MSKYNKKIIIPISIGIPIRVIKATGAPRKRDGLSPKRGFRSAIKGFFSLVLVLVLILSQVPAFFAFEAHVINVTATICSKSEIKSMGYWKTHSEIYLSYLPQFLGAPIADQIINTQSKVDQVFNDYNLSMRNKLRGQLLAMKFNIAAFGVGGFEYFVQGQGTSTLDQIVIQADDLLRQSPAPSRSVLEKMKNLLDEINNLEQIRFCSVALPHGCQLRLTKTADSAQVNPGDQIIYHLAFDNIGDSVCTGGGVRLRDIFDKSLEYLNYTSTRSPNYFVQGCDYIEWNFGSIYPQDPLINIDLKMKVSEDACNAKCASSVTNAAKYWSDQTDWGQPVSVSSQVACQKEDSLILDEQIASASSTISEILENATSTPENATSTLDASLENASSSAIDLNNLDENGSSSESVISDDTFQATSTPVSESLEDPISILDLSLETAGGGISDGVESDTRAENSQPDQGSQTNGPQISQDQQPAIEPAPAIEQQTIVIAVPGGDGGDGAGSGSDGGSASAIAPVSLDSATAISE